MGHPRPVQDGDGARHRPQLWASASEIFGGVLKLW